MEKFPNGFFARPARKKVEDLLRAENRPGMLERFLADHPGSEREQRARDRWVALEWKKVEHSNDVGKLRAFLDRFGESAEAKLARTALAILEFQSIRSSRERQEIERFIVEFNGSPDADQARQHLAALERETPRQEHPLVPDPVEARWQEIEEATDPLLFDKFAEVYPEHLRASNAKLRATTLRHEARTGSG